MGLQGLATFNRRQIGLRVKLENLPATFFGLLEHLLTRDEPNPPEDSVECHEFLGSVERMVERVDRQPRRLFDEVAIERLAFAELPFRVCADGLGALAHPSSGD